MVESKILIGGTGLGLTITKRLVEMMNGRVVLESALNEGSLFTLHFPDVKGSYPRLEVEDIKPEFDMAPLSFEPAQILVVDDVTSNRELIKDMLADTDLEITEAQNGVEGLALIRCKKSDLVLLDIRMPVMDGYTMLREMKIDDVTKHIPVIAITASVDVQEKTKLDFSSFDSVLFKPISRGNLVNELSRFLRSKALTQPREFRPINGAGLC